MSLQSFTGRHWITEEGEAIEGDALDDVEVFGVLTHSLNRVGNDDCPAI
jgi:DNA polymerase V